MYRYQLVGLEKRSDEMLKVKLTMISECQAAIILLRFRRSSNSSMSHQNFLLGLLLAICIMVPSASCQSNMTMNDTRVASQNQTLVSPGGIFEMGFYAGGTRLQTYTLAIWYAQAKDVLVWMADRSLNLSGDATLLLSAQGNLEVYGYGDFNVQPQWSSSQTTTLGVGATVNAIMVSLLDTGNLVLLNKTDHVVWQSFDSPTDTLLPGQRFAPSSNVTMTAWQGPANWSEGRYALTWLNGELHALYHQPPTPYATTLPQDLDYWNTITNSSYAVLTTEGLFQAVDVAGSLSITIGNSSDVGLNHLRRFTIDYDGNMRIHSWDGNTWIVVWTAISSNCTLYNYCGSYSLCDGTDTNACYCLPGFERNNATDPTQGCKRTTEIVTTVIDNGGNSSTVLTQLDMYPNKLVDSTRGIHYVHYQNVSLKFCLEKCMGSSICEAAVTSDADAVGMVPDCWLKQILYAGQLQVQHRTTYVKLAVAPVRKRISRERQLMIGLITLSIAFLLLALVFAPILWFALERSLKRQQVRKLEEKWVASKGLTVRFTYGDIQLATRNFEQEIGKGGYGSVFKGDIGMQALVAVKRLDKLSPSDDEFVNEVDTIGCIHHINLVRLHGYCAAGNHKLLVYEFVENSSLDKSLFRRDNKPESPILEWRSRFQIATQTARGLAYLHEDVRDQRIIHCDIKPENILLDARMTAKVADFGLSRILNREQTRTMTKRIRGTTGYLAPEWTSDNTPITAKIDVFSFGMVLLEIVSGRRNLRPYWIHDHEIHDSQPDCRYYPQWAFPKIETQGFLEVVDESLHGIVDATQVKRALLVAFWCINENPNQRPTMSKVVQLLEGHIPIQQPVPRPRFLDDLELDCPIRTSRFNSSRESDSVMFEPTDPSVSPLSEKRMPTDSSFVDGR